MQHPRDRKSAAFVLYVDYIYKVMTQPQLELAPPSKSERKERAPAQMLPHSRPGGVAGLIELLNDRGGEEDLYHIADELLLEVDDLLPILDAATMLGVGLHLYGELPDESAPRASPRSGQANPYRVVSASNVSATAITRASSGIWSPFNP